MNRSLPPPLPPALPRRRRWSWRKIFFVSLLVLVTLMVVALLGTLGWYDNHIEERVAALEAEVRAAGYPVTVEELEAWYPEPAENAAPMILRAAELLLELDPEDLTVKLLFDQIDGAESDTEERQQHLLKMRPVLEALVEAEQIEVARFPLDLGAGVARDVSHLEALRGPVYLAVLAAEDAAARGDHAEAVNMLILGMNTVQRLGDEPILISQLTMADAHGFVYRSLGRVLNASPLPSEQLLRLDERLFKLDFLTQLHRAMAGERVMTCITIEAIYTGGGFGASDSRPPFIKELGRLATNVKTNQWMALREKAIAYEYYRHYFVLPEAGWAKLLEMGAESGPDAYFPSVVGTFVPAMGRAIFALARAETSRQTARVAIAVERFRNYAGNLPDTLDELVPEYLAEVPADPFDDQPLRYRRLDTGYVVYSVFSNRVDDGGEVADETVRLTERGGDWVFHVAR